MLHKDQPVQPEGRSELVIVVANMRVESMSDHHNHSGHHDYDHYPLLRDLRQHSSVAIDC